VTTGSILEVAAALLLIGASIWMYRRRSAEDRNYGSQGAVLVLAIGVIMLIHGLGLLEYRPSPGELGR
jgi:hypothetical protein